MRQKDAEEGRPGRKERRGEGHPQRAQACPGDDLTSGGGGFHSFRQQHLWSPDYQASCQVLRVQIHQPSHHGLHQRPAITHKAQLGESGQLLGKCQPAEGRAAWGSWQGAWRGVQIEGATEGRKAVEGESTARVCVNVHGHLRRKGEGRDPGGQGPLEGEARLEREQDKGGQAGDLGSVGKPDAQGQCRNRLAVGLQIGGESFLGAPEIWSLVGPPGHPFPTPPHPGTHPCSISSGLTTCRGFLEASTCSMCSIAFRL